MMLFPLYCLNCPSKISHFFLSQIDGLVSAYPCGYALRNPFSEIFSLSCFPGSSRSFQRKLLINLRKCLANHFLRFDPHTLPHPETLPHLENSRLSEKINPEKINL